MSSTHPLCVTSVCLSPSFRNISTTVSMGIASVICTGLCNNRHCRHLSCAFSDQPFLVVETRRKSLHYLVYLTVMKMYLYTAHCIKIIPVRFMVVNNFFWREWDRTWACKGAAGSCYQSLVDLTHPPNTRMHMNKGQKAPPQHTGNTVPYSLRIVWVL